MSNTLTLARPYAKAIFEHARDNNALEQWSGVLRFLTSIIGNKTAASWLQSPNTSADMATQFLTGLVKEKFPGVGTDMENTVNLLTQNKRLPTIPGVFELFEAYRKDYEKTLDVEVVSFTEWSNQQLDTLKAKLKNRFKRDIQIQVKINPDLLGGAIIRAGDTVIDGSLRTKLNKLRATLAA